MNKVFKTMAMTALAFSFTGCGEFLEDFLNDTEALTQEIEEMESGKLFQVEQATVQYENMGKIAFRNYGKDFYMDNVYMNDSTVELSDSKVLVTDGIIYLINDSLKSYTKTDYRIIEGMADYAESLYMVYARAFVYMNETYKNAVKVGKLESAISAVNIKAGTMTVAGKECDYISYSQEDGFVKMGGYKRVLMYLEDNSDSYNSGVLLKATSFSEKADESLFTVPAGYREVKSNED